MLVLKIHVTLRPEVHGLTINNGPQGKAGVIEPKRTKKKKKKG